MSELSQDLLKELFDYRDGHLYWKVYKASNAQEGDLAGCEGGGGGRYQVIRVNDKLYLTHRLIFLYHHGYLPNFLDHIDRNKSNNHIENLREATKAQNGMNSDKRKSHGGKPTSSDYKGCCWDKSRGKWMAYIQIDEKRKQLGRFDSELEAARAYNHAALEHYGEFAKLNYDL